MPTIESIKNRARQILDDANLSRYSDALLENAIRQELSHLDEKLPLVRTLDLQISSAGKDQDVTGMVHPLYLIQLCMLSTSSGNRAQAIKTGYAYTLEGETGTLHFNDIYVPSVGETLRVTYAGQNTLAGLDGAEESTIPDAAASALETGSASFACLLRAVSLAETYGARTGESARLVEQSRLWREISDEAVNKLKSFQEFSYPAGFALDQWDEKGR